MVVESGRLEVAHVSAKLHNHACPVTVLEAIKKTAEFFESKGVDSPRLQAELLLAHVLKLPRLVGLVPYEMIGPEANRIAEWVAEKGPP